MSKCVFVEMARISFGELWDVCRIVGIMTIVMGIPLGIIYFMIWMARVLLGSENFNIFIGGMMSIGLMVSIVFMIRDLYLKAKKNCNVQEDKTHVHA